MPRHRLPVSALLAAFLDEHPQERFSLGELEAVLGDRTFGVLFVVLALPNVIPLPGLSTVVGLPMALIALQMALGWPQPWLPRRISNLTFERDLFRSLVARANPYLERIERGLRPSWGFLIGGVAERLVGLFIMTLGVVLALPIPFGNFPPALAVAIIALGQIEHDGRYVAAGLVTGLIAMAIAGTVVTGMVGGAILLARQFLA